MLNPAHLLEIALLLLVAFLIGATIGAVARLAVLRLTRPKAVVPSEVASAPVVEVVASLVTAPVIEPVSKSAAPVAPAEVPAMDFTEALLALAGDKPASLAPIKLPSITPLAAIQAEKPTAEVAPARVAGETTSGRLIAHPQVPAKPVRTAVATGFGAEVIPFPVDRAPVEARDQPVTLVVAELQPPSEPEVVAAVELPPAVEPDAQAQTQVVPEVEVVAETTVEIEVPVQAEVEIKSPVEAEVVSADLPEHEPSVTVADIDAPVVETVVVAVEPIPEVAVADVPKSSEEDDEAAAMRAIEGNWSPRRGASNKARKVALPEGAANEAVAASAAAVASAVQAASVAITAEPEEAPGKPTGLAAPRHGVKDDLTHVIGILPIIETALNRLGVYHFDQVAELTDENAGWIETHLGIAGRVGREHWREQAKELAAATAGAKKAAGKQ